MAVFRLSGLAAQDLEKIADYIGKDNPQAAVKTVDILVGKMEFLAKNPGIHAAQSRYNGLCMSSVGKYLIFYRPVRDGIAVARVIHGMREMQNVLKTTQ
jgi:toxin ParE1/3/4